MVSLFLPRSAIPLRRTVLLAIRMLTLTPAAFQPIIHDVGKDAGLLPLSYVQRTFCGGTASVEPYGGRRPAAPITVEGLPTTFRMLFPERLGPRYSCCLKIVHVWTVKAVFWSRACPSVSGIAFYRRTTCSSSPTSLELPSGVMSSE